MRLSRSRISRRIEKQSKRSSFLALLGTGVIVVAIFKFGIPLIAQLGTFFENLNPLDTEVQQNSTSFLQSPRIDVLPIATNSAAIKIAGVGIPEKNVELFVGEELVSKVKVDEDGKFAIASLKLNLGQNIIRARMRDNDNTSDFSESQTVIFDNTPPSLEVISPNQSQSFSKDQNTIEVKGKTEKEATVTVNDFRAIVDGDGSFSYLLRLSAGENIVRVKAQDLAGEETQVERKITYSP